MNKTEILKRLLINNHITFEEALELYGSVKEYIYVPYQQITSPAYPVQPYNPYPYWWVGPGTTSTDGYVTTTNSN